MNRYLITICLLYLGNCIAGTHVGNGDEGDDLEGVKPITSGPIIGARAQAVTRMNGLHVNGIHGLGNLLPELSNSELYLASKDVFSSGATDDSPNHTDVRGLVFARTFARPHAATRFFPVALSLNSEQLVALHIHEALHRALSSDIQESESVVSQLTLALTAPDASHDSVLASALTLIPINSQGEQNDIEDSIRSHVAYENRLFLRPSSSAFYPINRMQVVSTELYPFSGTKTALGLGLEMSAISRPSGMFAGPLGLFTSLKILSRKGSTLRLFARSDLNTLSAEELRNSPFGRDVYRIGLNFRKEGPLTYMEDLLSYQFEGGSAHQIGPVRYNYSYGWIINARIRGGVQLGKFQLGGFGEIYLSDYLKISDGTNFAYDSGRYRILSAGPEIGFSSDSYSFFVIGRCLIDSTKDATFDYLGSLLGAGVAQGSLGAELKIQL